MNFTPVKNEDIDFEPIAKSQIPRGFTPISDDDIDLEPIGTDKGFFGKAADTVSQFGRDWVEGAKGILPESVKQYPEDVSAGWDVIKNAPKQAASDVANMPGVREPIALAEGAGSLATGGLLGFPGGLVSAGASVGKDLLGGMSPDWEKARTAQEDTMGKLTYQPQTGLGQQTASLIASPFTEASNAAASLSDTPEGQARNRILFDIALMIAPFAKKGAKALHEYATQNSEAYRMMTNKERSLVLNEAEKISTGPEDMTEAQRARVDPIFKAELAKKQGFGSARDIFDEIQPEPIMPEPAQPVASMPETPVSGQFMTGVTRKANLADPTKSALSPDIVDVLTKNPDMTLKQAQDTVTRAGADLSQIDAQNRATEIAAVETKMKAELAAKVEELKKAWGIEPIASKTEMPKTFTPVSDGAIDLEPLPKVTQDTPGPEVDRNPLPVQSEILSDYPDLAPKPNVTLPPEPIISEPISKVESKKPLTKAQFVQKATKQTGIVAWINSKGGMRVGNMTGELRDVIASNPRAKFLNRKNGKFGIDQLAQMAHDEGLIRDSEPQTFLDALANKTWKAPSVIEQKAAEGEGKRVVDIASLKPGDAVIINGERFDQKGLDKDGNMIWEDGEIIKIDPFDVPDIKVDKVIEAKEKAAEAEKNNYGDNAFEDLKTLNRLRNEILSSRDKDASDKIKVEAGKIPEAWGYDPHKKGNSNTYGMSDMFFGWLEHKAGFTPRHSFTDYLKEEAKKTAKKEQGKAGPETESFLTVQEAPKPKPAKPVQSEMFAPTLEDKILSRSDKNAKELPIDEIKAREGEQEAIEAQGDLPIDTKTPVGAKVRVGKSPQPHTIAEVLEPTAQEKANGEKYYRVKNDKTGEVETFESKDLKLNKGQEGITLDSLGLQQIYEEISDFVKSGKPQEAFDHVKEAGKRFYEKGADNILKFRIAMQKFLGKHWNAFKGKINDIFSEVKRIVGNERGSIKNPFKKSEPIETGNKEIDLELTKWEKFRRASEDLNIVLKKLTKEVERTSGVKLPYEMDIYAQKDMFPRQQADMVRRAEKSKIDILRRMVDAKIDLKDLDDLLHAQHAIERNAEMNRKRLEIGKPLEDGLSGMTNEKAKEIMQKHAGNQAMQDIANDIRTMSRNTLDIAVEAGLLTKGEADTYKAGYKDYVPLYRDMEGVTNGPGTGMGIDVKGPEFKRAKGSLKEVTSIVGNTFYQREKVLAHVMLNDIGKSINNLVTEYPELKDFFKIEKDPQRPVGTVTHKASLDKEFINKLVDFAKSLGLKTFQTKGQPGRNLGYYEPGIKSVTRRFATDREVTAHEVGHFLDDKYGLKEKFYRNRKATKDAGNELFEFSRDQVGETNNRLKKPEERFANAFEWWLTHRDLAKEQIPIFDGIMTDIIKGTHGLNPLLNIKPTPKLTVETMRETVWGPQMKLADNVIGFKIDGIQHYITTTPDLARALKNLQLQQLHPAVRAIRSVLGVWQGLMTRWRPEFLLTNLERDLGEALINLGVERGQLSEQGKGLRREVIKNLFKSQREIYRYMQDKTTSPKVDEFFKLGGDTGHFWMQDAMTASDNIYKLERQIKNEGWEKVKNPIRAGLEFVDAIQSAVELGIRYSAYDALTRRGMNKQRAIQAAADLTINFTRQGELAPLLKSAYGFINPSIQGTSKVIRTLAAPEGRKAVATSSAGLIGLGFAVGLLSNMLGGKDEDDKIPEPIKNSKVTFSIGKGKTVTLWSMPYGWMPFYSIGRNMADMTFAGKSKKGAGLSVMESMAKSFSPIDTTGSPGYAFIPTLIRPFADVEGNKSWTGHAIYPNEMTQKGHDYKSYFKDANPLSITTAAMIHKLTGADVHPGSLDYLSGAYFGGPGGFAVNSTQSVINALNGKYEPNKIPFARQFYREQVDKRPMSKQAFKRRIMRGNRMQAEDNE